MSTIYLNSKEEIPYYKNLALVEENSNQSVAYLNGKKYTPYAIATKNPSINKKIRNLFQLICLTLLIPFTLCSKTFQDRISHKIQKIKDPKQIHIFLLNSDTAQNVSTPKQQQENSSLPSEPSSFNPTQKENPVPTLAPETVNEIPEDPPLSSFFPIAKEDQEEKFNEMMNSSYSVILKDAFCVRLAEDYLNNLMEEEIFVLKVIREIKNNPQTKENLLFRLIDIYIDQRDKENALRILKEITCDLDRKKVYEGKLKDYTDELICPISLENLAELQERYILLEDGFTYSKSIKDWIKKQKSAHLPLTSPSTGSPIAFATILPNAAIGKIPVCPLTKNPFIKPYYLKEDAQTYDLEAILDWFKTKIREKLSQDNMAPITLVSPFTGYEINCLTLYPNKVFFKDGNIPTDQLPIKIYVDVSSITKQNYPSPVLDAEIVELVKKYAEASQANDNTLMSSLRNQINDRRNQLGLETFEGTNGTELDLSFLNLKGLNFVGLRLKNAIFRGTDLSVIKFASCQFSNCKFISCRMEKTFFANCHFQGSYTSFLNCDVQHSLFISCTIEEGCTWKTIDLSQSTERFRSELKARGALNTEKTALIVEID